MTASRTSPIPHQLAAAFAVAVAVVALDLTWLGVVAAPLYAREVGTLMAREPFVPAALAFYVMYVTAVTRYAVLQASSLRDAIMRGASLGWLAYATYELTNWAVLRDWSWRIVVIDIAWGVFLTASAASVGFLAKRALANRMRA